MYPKTKVISLFVLMLFFWS